MCIYLFEDMTESFNDVSSQEESGKRVREGISPFERDAANSFLPTECLLLLYTGSVAALSQLTGTTRILQPAKSIISQ